MDPAETPAETEAPTTPSEKAEPGLTPASPDLPVNELAPVEAAQATTGQAAPVAADEPPVDALFLGGIALALLVGLGGGLALSRRGRPVLAEPPTPVALPAEPLSPEDPTQVDEPALQPVAAAPAGPSILERMRTGLARTSAGLGRRLASAFGRDHIDDALFEDLEEALLMADVGVKTTTTLLEGLRDDARTLGLEAPGELQASLRTRMLALFEGQDRALGDSSEGPTVILVVGVNGSGKTTTIGKLAARYGRAGKKVLLGAGDTFRAGAIEQLRIWSERAGTDFVAHLEGADPAAVLFDALEAAVARGSDVVLCDTAGRLQSKKPLMAELEKVHRVVGRAVPGAPHEVLLVLDATMGQNALSQARTFGEVTGVTGVVLTKLDGTAKGGIVLAVAAELGLPVKFIGVGEQVDDLRPFDPDAFVEALLEPASAGA
jgi:fused signal recognition particle receptor